MWSRTAFFRFSKRALLHAVDAAGINTKVIQSSWRRRRLLIVCWHGISNDDEHCWNPGLFISVDNFRARLELLRAMKCSVLPLGEALARVSSASLPPRAVALTMDDGDSSFYLRAWPLLREYSFPVTLYWTTYYSTRPYAVFDPMLSYLLWKGRHASLVLGEPALRCNLRSTHERLHAFNTIYDFSRTRKWTAARKEAFLARLAGLVGVDYSAIKAKRILHLITPAEARAMVAEGLDLQLHTHRHRVPRTCTDFTVEVAENSAVLREAEAKEPAHFCYPSGSFLPEFAHWLRDWGIRSAVTCEAGLVDRHVNPYFLPRLIDHGGISQSEFRGWLSGIAATMRGKHTMDYHGFR